MSLTRSRGGLTTEEIPVHPVAGLTPAEQEAYIEGATGGSTKVKGKGKLCSCT